MEKLKQSLEATDFSRPIRLRVMINENSTTEMEIHINLIIFSKENLGYLSLVEMALLEISLAKSTSKIQSFIEAKFCDQVGK